MNNIYLKANAKINLSIDILKKRDDGYHEVKMIMQSIDLHDDVYIETTDEGIYVDCDKPWVPTGSGNIAYKAAELLKKRYGIKKGIKIKIIKNIPVSAGLAGGSTDAAAVIEGINKLFSLNLDQKELMELGKTIGADVPFCIKGGTMLSEGIGEILTPIESFNNVNIVAVKPKVSVSTVWVYKNLNLSDILERPNIPLILEAIKRKDIEYVAKNMKNVLETVTIKKYGVIEEIKQKLIELGALGSMMSGSGPTVFGIFESREKARFAYEKIKNNKWECFMAETLCEEM
ncbi:MAG: 4-(cytidine 5'-diphospho)-2-C-methyl-D-erythritol kinase [Clostridium sp.]|jgi:4-diphosphocytidyl-2-C-methyl-D-erythritol kinase|nr:4-(cytidine 5'-diphospho)-2-C-methyl-D-erythritol kinase [Clostridium sp.]